MQYKHKGTNQSLKHVLTECLGTVAATTLLGSTELTKENCVCDDHTTPATATAHYRKLDACTPLLLPRFYIIVTCIGCFYLFVTCIGCSPSGHMHGQLPRDGHAGAQHRILHHTQVGQSAKRGFALACEHSQRRTLLRTYCRSGSRACRRRLRARDTSLHCNTALFPHSSDRTA